MMVERQAARSGGDSHPEAASGTRYDLGIFQSLRQIIRAIDVHSRKLKAEHKITGPQLLCLLAIVEKGPLISAQIAEQVHLSPSTIVGILDRLEAKGLVRRSRDERDRRLIHISATERGRRLAREAPSPLQEDLAAALKRLPESEQSSLSLSLMRIVDLMKVGDIKAAPILDATHPIDRDDP
ncbi:MAG: MarR family winged helix-turn-helix transcriptional regulator [Fidelibacterota bacterium]